MVKVVTLCHEKLPTFPRVLPFIYGGAALLEGDNKRQSHTSSVFVKPYTAVACEAASSIVNSSGRSTVPVAHCSACGTALAHSRRRIPLATTILSNPLPFLLMDEGCFWLFLCTGFLHASMCTRWRRRRPTMPPPS